MDPTDVRKELLRLETALASRDAAAVEGGLDALIADDFVEIGASGRMWDAETIREDLRRSAPSDEVKVAAFETVTLADGVVLAFYRIDGPRPSYRSSI